MRSFAVLILATLFLSQAVFAAETIPFDICAESTTWVRPSPGVQAKVWNDPRYRAFGRTDYAWTHNFLVILDPESTNEFGYLSNLSGLWTVKPGDTASKCSSTNTRRSGYEWVAIWVLLHRVTQITHENNTYTVTVEPVGKGFQSVFIRRLNPQAVLRFVTPDGRELDKWDESAPPNRVKNEVPPGPRIIGPNGEIILK